MLIFNLFFIFSVNNFNKYEILEVEISNHNFFSFITIEMKPRKPENGILNVQNCWLCTYKSFFQGKEIKMAELSATNIRKLKFSIVDPI